MPGCTDIAPGSSYMENLERSQEFDGDWTVVTLVVDFHLWIFIV